MIAFFQDSLEKIDDWGSIYKIVNLQKISIK